MSDLKSVAVSLEGKIEKLVDLHHRTKKELSAFKTQNNHLTQTIDQHKQTIKKLEDKAKVLKLSKSLSTTNENTHELKLKINELIREVDKCISLLNK
jgi:predicted  nucleic acid-binding Zn-ribbon protein